MTTNDLPAPAGWIDKDGRGWKVNRPDVTADEIAAELPDLAPFTPVYRADDLPALVLPEVTDQDAAEAAYLARWSGPDTRPWEALSRPAQDDWRNTARAVRDLLASRMRKPTLADVLPDMPELGEGEWVACDGDPEDCPDGGTAHLRMAGPSTYAWWRFAPATPPDPDADAKAALEDAAHDWLSDPPLPSEVDGIFDALRSAGWELVRKEGDE